MRKEQIITTNNNQMEEKGISAAAKGTFQSTGAYDRT